MFAEDLFDDVSGHVCAPLGPSKPPDRLPDLDNDPELPLNALKERSKPFFSLRKELDQLRSLKATKLNDARQAEVEVESKKRHLEALKHQLQGLQKTKEEMRQSLEVAESRQAAVKSKVREEQVKFETYRKKTEDYIGLKLHITSHQSLVILFKNLRGSSSSNSGGKVGNSLCEITISDDKEYKVLHCMPQLDPAFIIGIEKCLNETQDLSGFICSLRKALKAAK